MSQLTPKKQSTDHKKPEAVPFLVQAVIFASVLFIASLVSAWISPYFLVPTPVAGLILLYLLLTFHIIKLEWVESLGSALIGVIGFLFVPSGISLIADLDVMAHEGIQLVCVITVATIILLVVMAYTTTLLAKLFKKLPSKADDSSHINKG